VPDDSGRAGRAAVTSIGAADQLPRRDDQFRADRIYLGWQYALRQPDPGPMPRAPVPAVPDQVSESWLAAQHREEARLARPATLTLATAVIAAGGVAAGAAAGALSAGIVALGWVCCAAAAGWSVRARWRGRRGLRDLVVAEEQRIAKINAVQQGQLAAQQEAHARQLRGWQQAAAAFRRQPRWYAVSLPSALHRIDIAGGTLAGWSALLTMIAAPRLAAGGDVTVLDLTEGGVAADLLALAGKSGIDPLVWVLPGDLPRLDLGAGLDIPALSDVLALTVSASDEPAAQADQARDAALLSRVLEVLGSSARIAQVTAALRALAEIGDPRADIRSGLLTTGQLERLRTLFGRGASERVVIDRAWAMEARLRALDPLGSAPGGSGPSRLRVAWLDRRSAAIGNKVLGTYIAVALTHMLREAAPGPPWQRTLCVLGAERLRGDVLDRLCDAAEISGTGLVVGYRSIPAPVRERLGRGHAAVAFMRLGNAEDARAAAEQIGTEHRLVLSQLTDTIGLAVTDTVGDSYTSTLGTADSAAASVSATGTSGRSTGRGRTRHGVLAPFGDFTGSSSRDASESSAWSDSLSLTEGISSSTAWGLSTSRATGSNASLGRTAQRSREFLVEQHELQHLPTSAVIVTYSSAAGRQVVLADANPGIIALPTATLLTPDEAAAAAAGQRPGPDGPDGPGAPAGEPPPSWRPGQRPRR